MKRREFCHPTKIYYKSLDNEIYVDKLILDSTKTKLSNLDFVRPQKVIPYLKKYTELFVIFYKLLFLFWEFFNIFYQTIYLIKVILNKKSKINLNSKNKEIILDLTPMLLQRLNNINAQLPKTYISLKRNNSVSFENNYTIYDLLSYSEIFKIYLYSIYIPYNYRKISKKKEHIIQTYTSFEWFCVWFALEKIKPEKIWFGNHCDRWAVLIDNISKDNTLVQHGIEDGSLNPPVKLMNVKKVFFFNLDQAQYFDEFMLKSHYELNVLPPSIKLVDINVNENLCSIMIIGNAFIHGNLEEIIISDLQNLNVDIFLKPHPNQPLDFYNNLKDNFNFIVIEQKDYFPKVDLVVGYNSTLALEYSLMGIPVLYYETEVKNFLKKIKAKVYEKQKY